MAGELNTNENELLLAVMQALTSVPEFDKAKVATLLKCSEKTVVNRWAALKKKILVDGAEMQPSTPRKRKTEAGGAPAAKKTPKAKARAAKAEEAEDNEDDAALA